MPVAGREHLVVQNPSASAISGMAVRRSVPIEDDVGGLADHEVRTAAAPMRSGYSEQDPGRVGAADVVVHNQGSEPR
jgi:hypothetical protein